MHSRKKICGWRLVKSAAQIIVDIGWNYENYYIPIRFWSIQIFRIYYASYNFALGFWTLNVSNRNCIVLAHTFKVITWLSKTTMTPKQKKWLFLKNPGIYTALPGKETKINEEAFETTLSVPTLQSEPNYGHNPRKSNYI